MKTTESAWFLHTQEVRGSSPCAPTILFKTFRVPGFVPQTSLVICRPTAAEVLDVLGYLCDLHGAKSEGSGPSASRYIHPFIRERWCSVQLTEPNHDNGVPAFIGRGTTIIGSIHSKQDLILDGELEGELDVENRSLTIGPHGKVTANAKAREVDIQGNMTGNVETSGKTCIRSSGSLVGDVVTGGIVIENGAVFRGNVEITVQPSRGVEVKNGE
ncbi:MAG TPA: polymer-forming cytoskeletal protein [Bryobacteraceae bacterium]|nr:polymer-forming cytoskeletal protein [Bryobacteraceae bacterium]